MTSDDDPLPWPMRASLCNAPPRKCFEGLGPDNPALASCGAWCRSRVWWWRAPLLRCLRELRRKTLDMTAAVVAVAGAAISVSVPRRSWGGGNFFQ